jgi:hypothetical protein
MVVIPGPEIIQIRVTFSFFPGELHLRIIGIYPCFLYIPIRPVSFGKNHIPVIIGYYPGRINLIGHIIKILVGLGFVLSKQPVPEIDVIPDAISVVIVFSQQLTVKCVDVIGIEQFGGAGYSRGAITKGIRR